MASGEPRRFLESVNQLFYENTADSAYTTLFFAEYDNNARRLRYANCGHLSALLLRGANTLERLDATCAVLGVFQDWNCCIEECQLFPGDTLVVYTDGVTEAFDEREEEFGEQRLIDSLQRYRHLPPQQLLNSILDDVQRFSPREQRDDITLIVAKCTER
jgi:serine phosphatase RsbU (regulator of sigma subunit)